MLRHTGAGVIVCQALSACGFALWSGCDKDDPANKHCECRSLLERAIA